MVLPKIHRLSHLLDNSSHFFTCTPRLKPAELGVVFILAQLNLIHSCLGSRSAGSERGYGNMTYKKVLGAFLVSALFPALSSAQDAAEHPTYAKEVSRIIQENCQVCHRPGQIGPMSLTSYEEVRPWAPLIQLKVAAREMPPYHYDTDVGVQQLKNDWRLSQEEIDTIVDWVNSGSPFGNPEDLPPARQYPNMDDWQFAAELGPPDHTIKTDPWDVPADGQDLWWKPVVDSGITESRCIKAVETRPSAAAIGSTHHANSHFKVQNADGKWVDGDRLSEFAIGKLGEKVPKGACRRVPANSKVEWEVHYYPKGVAVPNDQVTVGIWFYDEEDDFVEEESYPQDLRAYILNGGGDYMIPPHSTLMTQGFRSFDHPVRIDSWQPHMHLRGVAMKMEVFYPETGRTEVLSQSSNWTSAWNHSHTYEEGFQPLIPAGATIILTGWYDNTENNPMNPDPDQWVGAGQRTTDEMSHAWIAVSHLDQAAYEKLLAERKARDSKTIASLGGQD
jgi:mono/diheme cytochrome c family protein